MGTFIIYYLFIYYVYYERAHCQQMSNLMHREGDT